MTTITIVCSSGMSTSLLASRMNKAASDAGMDVSVRAASENAFKDLAGDTDVLLLGPQVGYRLAKMKAQYEPLGIKVAVINSIDYGMMDGQKVLKTALDMLKQHADGKEAQREEHRTGE